jgi:hypothetical protein
MNLNVKPTGAQLERPELKVNLTCAGEAEIANFLHIPTAWTIALNGVDYKVVTQVPDGFLVIPFRQNGISWTGKAPKSVVVRAKFVSWDDIRTLHVY